MAERINQLALFGQPVKHSQSPHIHQVFANQFGLLINYRLVEVDATQLIDQVRDFFAKGGLGANITVPHKTNIIPMLDNLTARAQKADAVNTLFKKGQQLWGDNTDGDGLVNDLTSKNITLTNKRVLILGAGGAVQGIIPALLDAQVASIDIDNRTKAKAAALSQRFDRCSLAATDNQNQPAYDLIIHGTTLGYQNQSPELKPQWFTDHSIAYDLSYGQTAQPFLTVATQHCSQCHDGLGMLYHQAALAFEHWFKRLPTVTIPKVR